jgi:hypothetical protein
MSVFLKHQTRVIFLRSAPKYLKDIELYTHILSMNYCLITFFSALPGPFAHFASSLTDSTTTIFILENTSACLSYTPNMSLLSATVEHKSKVDYEKLRKLLLSFISNSLARLARIFAGYSIK